MKTALVVPELPSTICTSFYPLNPQRKVKDEYGDGLCRAPSEGEDAGDRLIQNIKPFAKRTMRPQSEILNRA